MKPIDQQAMARALQQTRAGDLAAATAGIQEALRLQPQAPQGAPRVADGGRPDGPARRQRFDHPEGAREYLLHLPPEAPGGLIVMLHGCLQDPEDFAAGTRMSGAAAARGYAVLYPAQARGANAQSCWNWFSRGDQLGDRGEPAILSALTESLCADHAIPRGAVFAAGLSAGGAMAVVLGRTRSDLYSGIAVHSGLPYGRAASVQEAFQAMAGAEPRVAEPARSAPTLVIHGSNDGTVAPVNGTRIVADALACAGTVISTETEEQQGGSLVRRSRHLDAEGRPLAEALVVEGLGHAWSGGGSDGSFTAPGGLDATGEILDFFDALRRAPGQ